MTFFPIYLQALGILFVSVSLLWCLSLVLKNVSIVDIFWSIGFVIVGSFYAFKTGEFSPRKYLVLSLLYLWGVRLSLYLLIRNWGKGEDFRYQQFRKNYGVHRYWWVSFFQVFLLQGFLIWLISWPLLSTQFQEANKALTMVDYLAVCCWIIGFVFESLGDYQLQKFKADSTNKGKVLCTGLWKYTRHPNYFGEALIWWGFGLFSVATGKYMPLLSPLLMTILLLKVSGVSLLERSLQKTKPRYADYIKQTPAFFPWFPKKINDES